MDDVVLSSPATLHGRLQRGRGCAARSAGRAPGVADLVYDCVRNDPRWDPCVESRALYLARLMADLGLDVGPIGGPVGGAGDDTLAIDTLGEMVRLGRADAVAPLHRYAREASDGEHALVALLATGDPALLAGLGDVAAARCDDATLRMLAHECPPAFAAWARSHPDLRRAAAPPPRPRGRREDLSGRPDADLCARGSAAAIRELGRRRSPLVLDLAERLLGRAAGPISGAVHRAVRELGDDALSAARRWVAADRAHADVGVDVLAMHGTPDDAPALMAALAGAMAGDDWDRARTPVTGLGRLRHREAVAPILHAWEHTAYSYLRVHLLRALTSIDAHIAEPFAVEALWDCEAEARLHAARTAPRGRETAARLARMATEAAEDPEVRVAAGLSDTP